MEGSHVLLRGYHVGETRRDARFHRRVQRCSTSSASPCFCAARNTYHISTRLLTLSTPTTFDEHDNHDTSNTYRLTKRLVDPANTLEAASNRRIRDVEMQEGCGHAAWRKRRHRTCSAYSCGDFEMDVHESSDRFVLREGYIRDGGVRAERCVANSCHLIT